MRRNEAWMESARVCAPVVFASPGTLSSNMWPFASSATSRLVSKLSCPTTLVRKSSEINAIRVVARERSPWAIAGLLGIKPALLAPGRCAVGYEVGMTGGWFVGCMLLITLY